MKLKWVDWKYGLIFFIPLFLVLPLTEVGLLNGELIYVYFIAALLPIVYLKVYFPFKRIRDLKKFARLEKYKFFRYPSPDQLNRFRNFKSLLRIRNHQHLQFINLLVPINETNYPKKPIIATNIEEFSHTGYYGFHSIHTNYTYTQVYLFEVDQKLPIFYLESLKNSTSLFSNKTTFMSKEEKIKLDMSVYMEGKVSQNDFPADKYKLHSPEENIINLINTGFIEFLNGGIEKNITMDIESDGKNIVFYISKARQSIEHMKFYSEIFSTLIESLTTKKIFNG